MNNLKLVFDQIDWKLLKDQKLMLIDIANENLSDDSRQATIDGMLSLLDAIQDAAEKDGFPVVFAAYEELI